MPLLEFKCPLCKNKKELIRPLDHIEFCDRGCDLKMIRIPSITAKRRDMTVVENDRDRNRR